jgi:hypothetical protein
VALIDYNHFIAEDVNATSASAALGYFRWSSPFVFPGMTTAGSIL